RRDRRRSGRLVDLGRRPRAAARRHGASRAERRPSRRARTPLRLRRLPRVRSRDRPRARAGARSRRRARPGRRQAGRLADLYGHAAAARSRDRARPRAAVLGAHMRIRVGHLYPEYLNIYADRGNIAVLARRAALRGHELDVASVSVADSLPADGYDLLYIGGGQDREQALVAPDLAGKAHVIDAAVRGGAALLAVCGGYQLLGRGYRGQQGSSMPGTG